MQTTPPFLARFAMSKFLLMVGAALVLFPAANLRADAPPTTVRIQSIGADAEGRLGFQLEWDAVTNATYLLQSRDSLAPDFAWKTVDVVKPSTTLAKLTVQPEKGDRIASFYRLTVPRIEIFSVEPTVFPPGAATTVYLLGQCFESNDVVRVDGVVVSGVIYMSGGLLQCELPPQSAGLHLVELVRAGVVKVSFSVTCADAFANPELVLQGPPEEPPAAPRRPVGRITFKAKEGATRVRGLIEEIRENDNVVFEVQEGKKGLNAVNVKLARSSGEVSQQVVDLTIPGRGLDFIWARTYHSRIGQNTPQGSRWSHSYNIHLQPVGGDILVHDGTGRRDLFRLQTNGTYTCPEFFREGTMTGGVFRLTFADTGYWEFNPIDPVSPETKLARIVDRNGNTMSLNYDGSNRLIKVVDDLGRTNTVTYDPAGRVAGVTDSFGRTVTYQYYQGLRGEQGGAGDLKSVTSPPVTGTPNGNDFPTGKITTYTYSKGYVDDRENHLLLSVIDASGQIKHRHVYQHNQTDLEFLRCVSVQHWTNTPTMLSYLPQTPTPANQFATLRCIVNNPVGDVTECFFDARNRGVKLQEFTGRAAPGVRVTPTANRPAGKVRATDPDVYETRWSWNNDSLCTREVGPGGQQVQYVYESDFDPATRARKRADCRVVRERASSAVDSDGDGVADVTQRVWRYEYDPRFGSDPSESRLRSGVIAEVGAGCPATVGRARGKGDHGVKIITDRDSGRSKGFGFIKADEGQERCSMTAKPTGTGGATAGRARGIVVVKSSTGSGGGAAAGRARGIIAGKPNIGTGTGRFAAGPRQTTSQDGSFSHRAINTTGTGANVRVSNTGYESGDCDDSNNFVTSVTDPRGNVTTASYDATGKTTQWEPHKAPGLDSPVLEFAYNSHGELTAITNAADANGRRSVDTFAYAQGQVVQCVEDAGPGGLALTTAFEYDPRGNATRVIDPRGNDWLCTYNSLDQLVQTESAALGGGVPGSYRNKTQFSYDANDNLTLVAEENRDAAGTPGTNAFWRTQFIYDGGQRLTGCWRDKNGALVLRCTEVAYNAANQVVLYRSPEAVNGHDALNTVAFAYDERGLRFRTIGAPGSSIQSTTQCDYDANGNVTRVSEGLEGTPSITMIEYDGFAGFGFWSGAKTFRNSASSATYDGFAGFGSSSRQIGGGGNSQASDGSTAQWPSRVAKITDALGNQTTFAFDACDNLKIVRRFGQLNDVPGTNGNIRLAETRYQYDALNRLVVERALGFTIVPPSAPSGSGDCTTTFAYAPNGECTAITDALGRVTTFAYDTACRPSSVTSPGGKSVVAVFRDQAGNVTQTTQTDVPDLGGAPQVFTRANVYDALNRPVSTTDNVGNSHLFAYDSRDNCVRATDANGNETVYVYDGLSRQVSFTITQGAASSGSVLSSGQFEYDDNDRCISRTDANGNVTLSAYDSLDRPTQTTQADGTHHTFVWDSRSNLIQETDANGTVILHAYDLNDRCISNHITPGAGVAATTTVETFAYDGASRLVSANNDGSQSGFEYDSLGNCTRGVSGGLGALTTYDSVGNRLSLTYPGGRTLTYAYDVLDQCTNIMESGASLANFAYAGPGRVARVNYGNGTRTQIVYDGLEGVPNASGDFGHGEISSVTHGIPATQIKIAAVNLKWDRNGNKTARTDKIFPPAIPRTNDLALEYDAADRLTQAILHSGKTLLRDTVYGLDRMGNRTNVTGAASCFGSYVMASTAPPSDSQMNQYSVTPCDTRAYDDNGNFISRSSAAGPVTYEYDYANRLVQVRALDFNTGSLSPVATYAYDALGRRISKTVYSGGLPPATTQFVFDGDHVIEERSNGFVTQTFCYSRLLRAENLRAQAFEDRISPDKSTSGKYRDAVAKGVSRMAAFSGTGVLQYYCHGDDQGNVLALTGTSGNVLERYDYDDYGAVTFLTSDGVPTTAKSSAVGNPYCWHGLRLDTETGLQNNDGGDFFEPQSGRCLARAQDDLQRTGSIVQLLTRNNPWSGGGGCPNAMQKGTVKFFNEAKGFGFMRLLESIQDESKGFSSLIR